MKINEKKMWFMPSKLSLFYTVISPLELFIVIQTSIKILHKNLLFPKFKIFL